MRKSLLGLAVLAALSSAPAFADPQVKDGTSESDRVAALEARIQALETELEQIRAELAGAPAPASAPGVAAEPAEADPFEALAAEPEGAADATETAALAAPADPSSGNSGPNAFNPAITLILNGSVSNHDGFSLGESELALAANIDDKFFGQLTLAMESEDGEDGIGVEEAFIETTSLPGGLGVRAGRFFSNIGYLNSHHAHTDSFFDRPLAYEAFLDGQYGDDGVQLRWVAPTANFLELGGEVFHGESAEDGQPQRGGFDTRTLFVHTGGEAGRDNEWLAGVSVLQTSARTLYIADGTWKWAPHGNFKDGGVTVRSEYLRNDDDTGLDREGAYLEGVYRLSRTWDIGYRYDRLWWAGSAFDPTRHSAELTWRNSEFSLLRLQFGLDKPEPGASGNTITLQYQTSLGAHGAHKF